MVDGPQDRAFQVVTLHDSANDDAGPQTDASNSTSKKCSGCKQVKSSDAFHKSKKRNDGLQSSCKECMNKLHAKWRSSQPKVSAPLVTSKLCGGCKQEKPASDFYADRVRKDGLQTQCKACTAETHQRWRAKRRKGETRVVDEKTCHACCETKPAEEFARDTRSSDGLQTRCKTCCHQYFALWSAQRRANLRPVPVQHKLCGTCNITKLAEEFRLAHKSSSDDGLAPHCKACSRAKRAAAPKTAPAALPASQPRRNKRLKKPEGSSADAAQPPEEDLAEEQVLSHIDSSPSAAGGGRGADTPPSSLGADLGHAGFYGNDETGAIPFHAADGSVIGGSDAATLYSHDQDGGQPSAGDAAAARDALYASLAELGQRIPHVSSLGEDMQHPSAGPPEGPFATADTAFAMPISSPGDCDISTFAAFAYPDQGTTFSSNDPEEQMPPHMQQAYGQCQAQSGRWQHAVQDAVGVGVAGHQRVLQQVCKVPPAMSS